MLKLTVFQCSPSLTKQPNWAVMENNLKMAILSLKKKKRKKKRHILSFLGHDPRTKAITNLLKKGWRPFFKRFIGLSLHDKCAPSTAKMLKLTVFQGSPSLTKQPNWAVMENNPKTAILSLKQTTTKKYIFWAFSVSTHEPNRSQISWKRAEGPFSRDLVA